MAEKLGINTAKEIYENPDCAMAKAIRALASATLFASADTRPKGGDSTEIEAPFTSGATPEGGDAHD